jgi:hypothetical protein
MRQPWAKDGKELASALCIRSKNEMSVRARLQSFDDKTSNDLSADYVASEVHIKAQNEIAEYIFGMVAKRDGQPMDATKSPAWQRGWGDAQK